MVIDVSEASETSIRDERDRATHHHPKHIPRRRERVPELHQPFSHCFNRGYDRDDILHSLHPCLEGRSCLFVELFKPFLHFVKDGIIGVNRKIQEDVEQEIRRGSGREGREAPRPYPRVYSMDQFRFDGVDGYDPVLLEEHEEFDYLALPILHHGYMDDCEDVLPIVLQFRPLIRMDHVFNRVIVESKPLLQLGQLLLRRTLSIDPEQLALPHLPRKRLQGLRSRITVRLEKRETNQRPEHQTLRVQNNKLTIVRPTTYRTLSFKMEGRRSEQHRSRFVHG